MHTFKTGDPVKIVQWGGNNYDGYFEGWGKDDIDGEFIEIRTGAAMTSQISVADIDTIEYDEVQARADVGVYD